MGHGRGLRTLTSTPREGPSFRPSPLALMLVAVVIIVALRPLRAGDTFWHLSVGRYILATGSLPVPDPFGFVPDGGRWTPHSPLFALILELGYRGAGLAGVRVLRGLLPALFGLSLAALLRRKLPGRELPVTLLTAAMMIPVLPLANPRPYWVPLILMPLAWLWIDSVLAEEEPSSGASLWSYGLLAWLWAQLHASVLIALAAPVLAALLDARSSPPRRRRLLSAATLAALASLVTPNGPALWSYWAAHLPGPPFAGLIAEWSPPSLGGELLLVNGFLGVALVLVLLGRRRGPRWEIAWALIWLVGYTRQTRNLGLALLAMMVLVASTLREFLPDPVRTGQAPRRDLAWFAMLVLPTALVLTRWLPSPHVDPGELPTASLDPWLERATLARSFHPDYWGGYLSWRSNHRVKSYLDGRNDLYGIEPIRAYLAILEGREGWEQHFDKARFQAVIMPADASCLSRILTRGGWREAPSPGPGVRLLLPSVNLRAVPSTALGVEGHERE